jgi:hypothetical protein
MAVKLSTSGSTAATKPSASKAASTDTDVKSPSRSRGATAHLAATSGSEAQFPHDFTEISRQTRRP